MKQLLIGITNDNKKVIIYETDTLFELDCFTSMFDNLNDLTIKYNRKNNTLLKKIIIQTSNGNTINDIVYSSNVIPETNILRDMYYKYLLEDKIRIKYSYLANLPSFIGRNIFNINEKELLFHLKNTMKDYSKIRNIYFELLDHGKIKLILDKKEDTDYLKDLIDNTTSQDSNIDIILSKIKSNELEPNYFDHEEYLSMKSKGHKK